MFINEDLPTLERPIKAYSGMFSDGHLDTSELLITNLADLIFTLKRLESLKKFRSELV